MKKEILTSFSIILLSMALFFSCKKDVSRGIEIMNYYKPIVDNTPVVAPCESSLANNTVYPATSASFSGNISVSNNSNFNEIRMDSYSTYEKITIYLPGGLWPTKDKKYTLIHSTSTPSPSANEAVIMYKAGNYFTSYYYYSLSGSLYVNVTATGFKLTFCDIPIEETTGTFNSTTIEGKISVTL